MPATFVFAVVAARRSPRLFVSPCKGMVVQRARWQPQRSLAQLERSSPTCRKIQFDRSSCRVIDDAMETIGEPVCRLRRILQSTLRPLGRRSVRGKLFNN